MISRSLICLIFKSGPQMETISAREQVSAVRAVVTSLACAARASTINQARRWARAAPAQQVPAAGSGRSADGARARAGANKPQVIRDSTLIGRAFAS